MAECYIGLKVKDYYLACDSDPSSHKVRIYKGAVYGVPLVATADANASPVRIYDGAAVKALKKVPKTIEYNAANDYEPDNANQDYIWDKQLYNGSIIVAVENDASCDNGKRLRIDTPTATANKRCKYLHRPHENAPWSLYVDNSAGYTVTARLKVIDSSSSLSQWIMIYDGTYHFPLYFADDEIKVPNIYTTSVSDDVYAMDTTDAYHIYVIEVSGSSLTVKVDGTTRITATLDATTSSKFIEFGDHATTTTGGGEVYWDYIRYELN